MRMRVLEEASQVVNRRWVAAGSKGKTAVVVIGGVIIALALAVSIIWLLGKGLITLLKLLGSKQNTEWFFPRRRTGSMYFPRKERRKRR